jgi:aspartyl aminopeptidase
MAHALHPNYAERHEDHHQPKLHEGLVIKYNANQRYATNTVTAFLFKEVAKVAGVPTQVICSLNHKFNFSVIK